MSAYVCAFRGRRDDYQVPLALQEAGRLDRFITDAYSGSLARRLASRLPRRLADALRFRAKEGLPASRVRCLWGATLAEHLRHHLGWSHALTYARLDPLYSRAAAARARAARSDLFLYSPYAWEAFTARYRHQPRRLLFLYHPQPAYEARCLREDFARFPEVAHSYAQETRKEVPPPLRQRVADCWRHADGIVCASSFTRQTVLEEGADPGLCAVVPYGVEAANDDPGADPAPAPEEFQALFVGSGVQRKGLHHLLRAWGNARLPAGAGLTLVCRTLDPGLRERAAQTRGVRLLPGVGPEALAALYRQSSLFVMPSLIEGFGQVYLEALSHGCPVLGTRHTCLPDLGGPEEGIFLTAVADVDELVHRLENLSASLPASPALRAAARACARRFTWPRFRRELLLQL